MTLSMHPASVPVFTRALGNLRHILDKAERHAKTAGVKPEALLQARLAPNMFPLTRQIQSAGDIAKGCAARLAGGEPPAFADDETTFAQLRERLDKTLGYLATFKPEQIDGSEKRPATLKTQQAKSGSITFEGQQYLTYYALPNFYFHVVTAYAILRNKGVPLGKMDYLGAP